MYDFDGELIGHGIPAPSYGFSLSGYNNASWPDPYLSYRQNADSWFTKWCTYTASVSMPAPQLYQIMLGIQITNYSMN